MKYKTKILIAIDWYRPAHKAGGPITSIENLVDLLGDAEAIEFYIVCGNYDYGSNEPLNVSQGRWKTVGAAQVCYMEPKQLGWTAWRDIFQEIAPDVIHLQGLWSPRFSILPLLAARVHRKSRIVVSPRGMLTSQALRQKGWVKAIVAQGLKWIGAYHKVIFHSTNSQETLEIKKFLGYRKREIHEMPNVPRNLGKGGNDAAGSQTSIKQSGHLTWVFIGRISPEKNALLLLEALHQVNESTRGYFLGGYQDQSYFNLFKHGIDALPKHHEVTYLGEQSVAQLAEKLAATDLLVNTSISENFGHAMAEALSAGVPILVGPNTPWKDLWDAQAGLVVDYSKDAFAQAISGFAEMDEIRFSAFRSGAKIHFAKICNLDTTKAKYLNLYLLPKR